MAKFTVAVDPDHKYVTKTNNTTYSF